MDWQAPTKEQIEVLKHRFFLRQFNVTDIIDTVWIPGRVAQNKIAKYEPTALGRFFGRQPFTKKSQVPARVFQSTLIFHGTYHFTVGLEEAKFIGYRQKKSFRLLWWKYEDVPVKKYTDKDLEIAIWNHIIDSVDILRPHIDNAVFEISLNERKKK